MFLFQFIASLFSNLIPLVGAINNQAFPNPLTAEEEEYYFNKMAEGDKEAREKLIEHNLRLVAHIVKKYQGQNDDKEDLISIGTIGLIKAIDSFSPDKGTKLATYAARCIDNEILMLFRSTKKMRNDVSLYDPIGYDKEGNEIWLIDVVKDEENNETIIFVSGSAKPSTISTRIFGTKFSFEFSCDEDECNISNPNILVKMDNRF